MAHDATSTTSRAFPSPSSPPLSLSINPQEDHTRRTMAEHPSAVSTPTRDSPRKLSRALSDSSSFNYVRTQGVGLSKPKMANQHSPTILLTDRESSRKLQRRTGSRTNSVDLTSGELQRPLTHRSESLPVFPPPAAPKPTTAEVFKLGSLDDLPANPKLWTPTQLALYLSHVLKLTPAPLVADVVGMVVANGLTGQRFLRLKERDFRETLSLNIAWSRILAEAREHLRMECLRGRILGIEGPSSGNEADEEEDHDTLKPPSLGDKETWKYSWRRSTGAKSKGRVRGIAELFERPPSEPVEEAATPPRRRLRSLSTDSPSQEEPYSETEEVEAPIKWSDVEPLVLDNAAIQAEIECKHVREYSDAPLIAVDYGTASPSPVPDSEKVAEKFEAARLDRYGSISTDSGVQLGEDSPFAADRGDSVRHVSPAQEPLSPMVNASNNLIDIFAVADKVSEDLDVASVRSKDGSMVLVKRSQLNELTKRMDEMDRMLKDMRANEVAEKQRAEEKRIECKAIEETKTAIRGVGEAATAPFKPLDKQTWTGLSSYVALTSIGLGMSVMLCCSVVIVANRGGSVVAEMVVSKVFRR